MGPDRRTLMAAILPAWRSSRPARAGRAISLGGGSGPREKRNGGETVGAIDVDEFMSVDGVIDEPGWTAEYGFDPRMGEALCAAMATCRGILLGRATYEMFAPAWSARTAEDDPAAIERLKEEVGGDVYVSGSGTLVRAML